MIVLGLPSDEVLMMTGSFQDDSSLASPGVFWISVIFKVKIYTKLTILFTLKF